MQENRFKMGRGRAVRFAALVCALAVGVSALAYYKQTRAVRQASTTSVPQVLEDPAEGAVIPPAQRNAKKSVDAASVPAKPAKPEKQPAQPEQTAFTIAMPVEGDLVQLYSMDHLSYDPTTRDWRTHNGVDIRAGVGAEVRAAADGTVAAVEEDGALGTVVTVRHAGGFYTRYGNLDAAGVAVGEQVRQGDVIGCIGASALMESGQESHLHFELCAGENPLNPADYFSW